MSQISWKTLMLGRFFPTGFPTPNLRIWLKRWANRRDNTVAIFDMFQLKKACFLSRINRTRIPSDEKPPMIVPASPRFAPQIPSSIMREFEQKSGCEYKILNHQLVPQIWPCCSLVIFAGYPFWGGRYSFFLVTFKIPIKVLVLIEIPCAGERSSCRGTNCKKILQLKLTESLRKGDLCAYRMVLNHQHSLFLDCDLVLSLFSVSFVSFIVYWSNRGFWDGSELHYRSLVQLVVMWLRLALAVYDFSNPSFRMPLSQGLPRIIFSDKQVSTPSWCLCAKGEMMW